ncbi:hypothetical protein AGLY_011527 [Aphis glycines]|uniref:Endonuclease/exonuclease/phosphatase domain-containing protein n=1 Tax=Aphis glycines TaxID=307491 RepID=A0A6G0TBR7_APHGL|nr:hypothetical protein AGLY_011527 [Aphis glycines]
MDRAAGVNDQLLDYCQRLAVDIAMVQEPYTNRGKLTGFEVAPFRSYLSKVTRRRGRMEYLDFGAAIIIFNPDLVIVPREAGTTENFVTLDIDCGANGIVTLISGYFKYRVPTAIHVAVLEDLLRSVSDKVLISLDANAFSKRWFSRVNDARVDELVMCIDANALEIANVPSPFTTFHGPRGSTNIDVTLADRALRQKLLGWSVIPGETSSDHQIIEFTVELQRREFLHREPRFHLPRQNYERFRQEYEVRESQRAAVQQDPDRMAEYISEDVKAAAAVHAPKASRRRKVTPPWKNKLESWRAFCTNEGVQPWGRLYRWLKNGSRKQTGIGLLTRLDGTRCRTLDESVDLLLNALIPNDLHRQVPITEARSVCDLQPLEESTIKDLMRSIAPNRAPGKDGITGRMKGRWTHECFPDIRLRLTLPIALGHEIAQFLTGHGNFQSKLAELGLRPTPHCSCGNGNEDVRHVLYDCTIHDAHRASLELAANRAGFLWPTAMRDLVSRKDTYVALVRFAKEAAYLERPQAAD